MSILNAIGCLIIMNTIGSIDLVIVLLFSSLHDGNMSYIIAAKFSQKNYQI